MLITYFMIQSSKKTRHLYFWYVNQYQYKITNFKVAKYAFMKSKNLLYNASLSTYLKEISQDNLDISIINTLTEYFFMDIL